MTQSLTRPLKWIRARQHPPATAVRQCADTGQHGRKHTHTLPVCLPRNLEGRFKLRFTLETRVQQFWFREARISRQLEVTQTQEGMVSTGFLTESRFSHWSLQLSSDCQPL